MARVIAVNRADSRQKANNYKPVSLRALLSKPLGRAIRNEICSHLVNNGLLNSVQKGFVKNRSCPTNL